MRLQWFLPALALVTIARADTLTLRDGTTVEGSYLGGTARQIRMAVGDSIRSFDVSDVASIRFEGAAQASPAPVVAPAPAPATTTAAAPAPAPAAVSQPVTSPPSSASAVPAGSTITVRMIDEVDSKVNRLGQTFRASIDNPVMLDGREVIPRGADVTVRMTEVKDPSKITGGGQLTLALDSVSVNGRMVDASSEGVVTAGQSRKGESAKVIGGAAALGAIIGAIAGGGKGAALGGVSGAGAGTAVQVLTQGTRILVPSETRLTFTLQQPIPIQ